MLRNGEVVGIIFCFVMSPFLLVFPTLVFHPRSSSRFLYVPFRVFFVGFGDFDHSSNGVCRFR